MVINPSDGTAITRRPLADALVSFAAGARDKQSSAAPRVRGPICQRGQGIIPPCVPSVAVLPGWVAQAPDGDKRALRALAGRSGCHRGGCRGGSLTATTDLRASASVARVASHENLQNLVKPC
jgi:hypothetical protein